MLVPKPLALNLAMKWWRNSSLDRQIELISTLPDSLHESFCSQIKYLDSSINVQSFVENFYSASSPFSQPKQLLTPTGSRLFRTLVELNPWQASSRLLYDTLSHFDSRQIYNIAGDVRRNFVWSLEKLVYHADYFDMAAWCLFKLAQYESESFSNNATGIFKQLFRWKLSGTVASFSERLIVLDRALELNENNADQVIIKVIDEALHIDCFGFTRTVGAEHQGTRPELNEWIPHTYQEIYDYYKNLYNILIKIVQRGREVELVKDCLGKNIRGLIKTNQFEDLNLFIQEVINQSDNKWQTLRQGIITIFKYDKDGLSIEAQNYLTSWKEMIDPEPNNIIDLVELKILEPCLDDTRDEKTRNDDPEKQAKKLAKKIKNNVEKIICSLDLIFHSPQQCYSQIFAKHLILESSQYIKLLDKTLEYVSTQEEIRNDFLMGLLSGIHEKSNAKWLDILNFIHNNDKLVKYYPHAIRTGKLQKVHLQNILDLVKTDVLPSEVGCYFVYDMASDESPRNASIDDLTSFSLQLSKHDPEGSWAAINILSSYKYSRNKVKFIQIEDTVKQALLSVSFSKKITFQRLDYYSWLDLVDQVLSSEDQLFGINLCKFLIQQAKDVDVDYSILSGYLCVAFYKAFEKFGDIIWPKVSSHFLTQHPMDAYRLNQLLSTDTHYNPKRNSIFNILQEDTVIAWCEDSKALLHVAESVSITILQNNKRTLSPLIVTLVSHFGNNQLFVQQLSTNLNSRVYCGSRIPYLESDKEMFLPMRQHEHPNVIKWADDIISNIERDIKIEKEKRK